MKKKFARGNTVYSDQQIKMMVFLKKNSASSLIFLVWFQNLPAESNTPQNKKKVIGVSDPMEQSYSGYQTPENNFKSWMSWWIQDILGCESGAHMGPIHEKIEAENLSVLSL